MGWLVLVSLTVWTQASFFGDRPAAPVLPLIPIVFLGLRVRRERLLPAASVAGGVLALGTVSGPVIPVVLLSGLAILIASLRPFVYRDHPATQVLVLAFATLVFRFADLALQHPVLHAEVLTPSVLPSLTSSLVTGVVGFPAFVLLERTGTCRRWWTKPGFEGGV